MGKGGQLMYYPAVLSWLSSKVALISVKWNECKILYMNGKWMEILKVC